MDDRVFSQMVPFFNETFGNPHSADHSIGWQAARAVETAANQVASLIDADTDEIIFTSGATEANNLALLGLARRALGGERRRILVSSIEHKSVLAVSRILHQQLGYNIELLPVDTAGFINMPVLREMLADDVLIVSIMAVNNEIGTIQNISQLSNIIRENGSIFHCDAAQAPCAIDLNNFSKFVDLMSFSSHKMYGPQGIGALFIRRNLHNSIEPIIYGGGQQQELRSGTIPVALCVGMGAAAALLMDDSKGTREREMLRNLRDVFVQKMMNLQWSIVLNGPEGNQRHPGNANMRFDGFDAHDVLQVLQPRLAASTGSACTSGIPEPSHVLKAIGLSNSEAESSIRFSIGRCTTESDLDSAVTFINECLMKLS